MCAATALFHIVSYAPCSLLLDSLVITSAISEKLAAAGKDVSLDGAGKLPVEFIPASMALAKFCGNHLILQPDIQHFNWPSFFAACEGYRREDLRILKMDETTISQADQAVATITQRIAAWLHNSFQLTMDLTQLAAVIHNTFTNLKVVAEDNDFLQFSRHKEQQNSSWQYRLTYGVSVPGRPVFQALVTTITIWADIKEESSWWGLESSSRRSFGVTITGLELEVSKDFHGEHTS